MEEIKIVWFWLAAVMLLSLVLCIPMASATPIPTKTIEPNVTIAKPTPVQVIIVLPLQTPTPKVTARILTNAATPRFPQVPVGLPTVKGLPMPPILAVVGLILAMCSWRKDGT